jgi:hypothetical protein
MKIKQIKSFWIQAKEGLRFEAIYVADLIKCLKDMKKQQLQELCKERNLNINGTRLELIKRLSE